MLENATSATRHETPCEMMQRIAQQERQAIERVSVLADNIREQIERLQSSSNPNADQLAALKKTLATVEKQKDDHIAALNDIEIDISMFC